MASWTPFTPLATGVPLPSTTVNDVGNNTTFLWQKPYVCVYDSVGTAVTAGTASITQILLGGTAFDGYGWSISGNNLVVPLTGIYAVTGQIAFPYSGNVDAGGAVAIFHNGVQVLLGSAPESEQPYTPVGGVTAGTIPTTSGLLKCSANDTIGMYGQAADGTSLLITTIPGASYTFLTAHLIGSQ